jgi:hypothetical protein
MKVYSSKQILLFITGIHAIYFIAACYFKGIYLVDSYGYLMQADNMRASGSWYAEDWNAPLLVDYFSIRPPLYAWMIVAFSTIWNNIFLVLMIQNLLSILNCWLVYDFVKKHSGETGKIQRLMILCLVLYPAQMIHANFVMTEIVFQTLLLLLFFSILKFIEKPSWKRSITIAVLLSVCLLTKPVSLFLPFVVLIGIGITIPKHISNLKYILSLLIVGLTLHGICLQNKHATGYYHYSSIKNINQLKYNARYTLVNAKGEVYADSVIAACMREANKKENYGDRLQLMDATATTIITAYPLSFLKVYLKGVAAFFIDPGRFDVYQYAAIEEKGTVGLMYEIQTRGTAAVMDYLKDAPVFVLLILALNFCWNILVAGCFLYYMLNRKFSFKVRILLFLMVCYIAAATGPVGVSRYRVPVYPLLCIGVLFGLPERKSVRQYQVVRSS